jgi:CzcA family heavy metal efflux pump
MNHFKQFIHRPVYIWILIFFLVCGGFWSLLKMPIDYFPGLNYPLINVISQYPGVSPEDIEILMTRPIENELRTIRGIHRISSISSTGISQVTVEFSQGYDILTGRQLVSSAVSRLSGRLPEGVHPVIDNLGSRMQQIIGYTITNSGLSEIKLRQIVEYRLVPALYNVAGIARIEVFGGQRPAFVVEPDINALNRFHLSITDIWNLLKENNINVSGRYFENYHLDIPVRGVGQVRTLEDLRSLFVKTGIGGIPVYLKDIANIYLGSLPEHYIVKSNHHPAVAIHIQKESGFSTVEVTKSVDREIQRLQHILPEQSEIHKFYDQSEILTESMKGVRNEIWIGAILAIGILYFFLRRFSPTIIVALTIPLALFAALILMRISGYTLNMMTLAALTLSIGMVVDDSIIVMENIERCRLHGKTDDQAVFTGTREILGADISGTLTTIVVFVPLLFLSGFLGDIVLPFGMTISYTLLASLVLSLTVIPVLMQRSRPYITEHYKPPKFIPAFIRWNERWFNLAMRRKKGVFAVLTAVLLISALAAFLLNPVGLMPSIDEGALLVEYITRPGISLTESSVISDQLIREILKHPGVDNVYLKIGTPEDTYYIEDVNRGELLIKLKEKHQRKDTAEEILDFLKRTFSEMPGVVFLLHHPTQEKIDESFSGLPAFFGITVSGDNLDSLIVLSEKVETIAQETQGLNNIINNARFVVPQIEVIPNRPKLAYHGLSVEQFMRQMALAFRGEVVSYFIEEQIPVAIFLRMPESQRRDLEDLKSFPIRTGHGVSAPISEFAEIQYRNILPAITHLNSQREITIVGEVEGNLWKIVRHLKSKFEQLRFPAGYSVQIRGQYEMLIRSFKQFVFVILSAVVLIYLILYVQFQSFWQPFVILLKIPLDCIGVFIALLITRQSFNISVAIGLLTVIGVGVNNSIVLVDKVNRLQREQGLKYREALHEAVHLRARPIMMTSFTTIFALLPAAIGMGIGSRIHQPFAITLIGGMLTGLFFSLNVIPALYEGVGKLVRKLQA